MCGRFVSSTPADELAGFFHAEQVVQAGGPNFNVAPTSDVFVVYEDGSSRKLDAFHWGLVPPWAKEMKIGNRMINARSEGLLESKVYKAPFLKRRCIIPVDGFYEWKAIPGQKRKQPYFIHGSAGEPLAFAGLWETWKGGQKGAPGFGPEDVLRSCTIITGPPNETIAEIHDRMPAILPASAWNTWLDPELQDPDTLGRLLVPAAKELISLHPVGTEVNNVRNKGEHLIEEVDPGVGELFPSTGGGS